MVTLARRAQRIPFAPVVALLFGIAAAVLVAAVPQWMFERAVVASGLPTVLAAAAPPLGLVARILAIGLAFCAGALLVWIFVAPVTAFFEAKARARTPWRDTGYDTDSDVMRPDPLPPRRPIFAPDELGAPLMSDEAIAVALLLPEPASEQVDAATLSDTGPAVAAASDADSSIAALIGRLEDGLARRAANSAGLDGSGGRAMPQSAGSATGFDAPTGFGRMVNS